ncbi:MULTISPECIES: MalY/PatB family protein [Paraburkholderia]|uniref:MalY/PatB family protein n=1 Tax=Paraburkholderia TaxID=1822464 RepID=UPI00225A97A0|nr:MULTISPECIES: aminotransferase class I/II-fold pyridoxal phosphate-dependent enzyme [Paraburkholderia]MCX4162738.1 aminotransferase class I/II-fold pyridoxal phosphate-dependent enzyme [Paraburkholderia megapolitana]MDN7158233.1 aminotransferase class I/II-fold pyridoxal phosphate-dependent enzyme [Paraburkholderia sp. CHISQ3]MDQ6495280.1 aminotransferase class I/II-fold pyridoxal phosphate-dependent enzyme [Paraburkholderia megapolitana]
MIHETAVSTVASASREIRDFILSQPELLARQSYKWHLYPAGVIAACVADMDFRVAPEVQSVIQCGLEKSDYVYPLRDGRRADRAVAAAFAARMKHGCNWDVDPAQVLVVADLVQATYASILAFSEPGDGVVLQVPNYPPFREALEITGRQLIPLEMEWTDEGYVFDLEKLEDRADERTKLFILCNPQNPTGRVFTRAELERVAAFAERHNLIVVSDEIHSDLIHPGATHLPFATLSPAAASRAITLNSASKSFNIAGLRCGLVHFGTEALMQRFHARIPVRLTGSVNNVGIDATVAAWTDGHAWLDAVRAHLLTMRDYAVGILRDEIPEIRFHVPEATYLLWMDCSDLNLDGSASSFFLKQARIGFSAGETFHPDAMNFARMNFATSRPILNEILERMITAVRSLHR